ncbi:similar to 3' exoribonuclease family protein [Plenodomus lingam JN3]|uniref:Ribosomal RNA-processing protein 43 n=1 Tax=Leptosphaeria maculans (strain JN3 / isolate v23.1.3 / race Av1-4-5-6-7-8) TaxID=985895 RepID=E4ZPN2_LEPMJ|nr:similar to 3' exoribonuclease family protein [Plenodomus lingam JN3]CBX93417.1 similar to 3' exoribonuclease family protein [Plenodomus lingam JN3]
MATTAPAPSAPPALTFPRPIFAAVSPHPFLQAHLSAASKSSKKGLRANGRTAHEFRTPGLHTGSLTHCNGSAVVRLGNTSVVCGVRGEILREEDISGDVPTPNLHASEDENLEDEDDNDDNDDEISKLRLLVPNIELSTGSTPTHIPGNAPSTHAQTLITRIRSLLHSTRLLHPRTLRILHTPPTTADPPHAPERPQLKGYWVLYLDIFFISIDGNAFDAAWLSLLAALQNTTLPHAFYDDQLERILCSDDPTEARRLALRGCPVAASFAVFEASAEDGDDDDDAGQRDEDSRAAGHWILSDPDAFEESVCTETVCLVVDGRGGGEAGVVLRRVEKSGGAVVGRRELAGLVDRAGARWREVFAGLGRDGVR